jgi:chloramphenicol-sensitive protein RarD
MTSTRPSDSPADADIRSGLMAAVGAYLLWGVLPLYFKAVGDVQPLVILAHRIVWSVPTAAVLIAIAGKGRELVAAIVNPGVAFALAASSVAIAANWTIYIWAVTSGHVLQGSLGYYINPLVSFALAALFFGERFNRLQVLAFGLAGAGVINQAMVVGEFPWVALALAVSFAVYGAIRKCVAVDSRVGFAVEVGWLAPVAFGYLVFFLPPGVAAFGSGGLGEILLLVAAGPVTATPLILFAFGARRLKLSTIAALQYIGPTLQFAIGLAYGEPFTPAHVVTFALIWSGVTLFTFAALRAERTRLPAMAD